MGRARIIALVIRILVKMSVFDMVAIIREAFFLMDDSMRLNVSDLDSSKFCEILTPRCSMDFFEEASMSKATINSGGNVFPSSK